MFFPDKRFFALQRLLKIHLLLLMIFKIKDGNAAFLLSGHLWLCILEISKLTTKHLFIIKKNQ